jgi:ribonuclease D
VLETACAEERYAIDTEFHRERTYLPHLALVQLAAAGQVWVIDAQAVDVRPMKTLLEGKGLAIVHACSQDLQILQLETGALPSRLFDPQVAAGFLGHRQASLGHLLEAFCSVSVPKGDQLTDWQRRPLPDSAIRYAASDVEHLHALHDALCERLGERLAWAEEEIERVRVLDRSMRDPETAWWKLKGKGKLKGRTRKVAQSVAAWRERQAAKLNRPVRHILGDLALLSIAGRPPRDAQALRKTRGMGRLDSKAERSLLDAIERGVDMHDDDVVLPPREDGAKAPAAALALCQAWIGAIAHRENLDPGALATRTDVSGLITGGTTRLTEGWRAELVGAELKDLLAGKRAITFRQGELHLVPVPAD